MPLPRVPILPVPADKGPILIPQEANNISSTPAKAPRVLFPCHRAGRRRIRPSFVSPSTIEKFAQQMFRPVVNHIYNVTTGKRETLDTLLKGKNKDI